MFLLSSSDLILLSTFRLLDTINIKYTCANPVYEILLSFFPSSKFMNLYIFSFSLFCLRFCFVLHFGFAFLFQVRRDSLYIDKRKSNRIHRFTCNGYFFKAWFGFGVMECRHSDVFFIFSAWYMRIQTKLPNAKLKMIHSQNSQINKKKIFVNVISRVSQLYIVLYSE